MQTFLGIIVAIIFILAYFPQLKSLKNSSDISGISTFFWMLIALGTIIKKQEYNKVVDGETFVITLEYGMKEDKTNHALKATITHILDTKTGKKAKVYQDDITDLTHVPNVYQDSDILMKDSLWNIKKCLNDQIEMVINSRKNKESVENLMDELYEEGL